MCLWLISHYWSRCTCPKLTSRLCECPQRRKTSSWCCKCCLGQIAAYAQNYANQRKGDCRLIHSGGRYGENLAGSTGDLSGTDAVRLWVNEKADYNYNSNSCASGKVCGHLTQVVWKNTKRIGCAKVRCNNGGTFIICNYDPPGNYVGQKPY